MSGLRCLAKPVRRQTGHFLERARFLEKVRGVRDDRERFLALQLRIRVLLSRRDFLVAFAHDEKGGGFHIGQCFTGQIRPAAARHDRTDRSIPSAAAARKAAAPPVLAPK